MTNPDGQSAIQADAFTVEGAGTGAAARVGDGCRCLGPDDPGAVWALVGLLLFVVLHRNTRSSPE